MRAMPTVSDDQPVESEPWLPAVTGFYTFYLREAGLGFGYRYANGVLSGRLSPATSVSEVVALLDQLVAPPMSAAVKAWTPPKLEPGYTLTLRAAIAPRTIDG